MVQLRSVCQIGHIGKNIDEVGSDFATTCCICVGDQTPTIVCLAQIFALLQTLQFLCHTEKNIRVTGDTESSTETTTLAKEVGLRKFHCIKKLHLED